MYDDDFESLAMIENKKDLGKALAARLSSISIHEVQAISAGLEREINALPSPYREQIRPYFIEQYFLSYYRILAMSDDGSLERLQDDIKDRALFKDYCATVARFMSEASAKEDDRLWRGGFYYLVSCFVMFVLDEPGHPRGMPFPGGFMVFEKDGVVYCPIRDKEKDVQYSICNFCPAKQDERLK